jgi:hypothetical protein
MSNYEGAVEVKEIKRKSPIIVTTGAEWIGITVVIVLAILSIVLIYLLLRPRIRGRSTYEGPKPPTFAVECPTSVAPTGLTAFVGDVSKASFDASWNPVLVPTTLGAMIVGYNIYVSTSPGITTTNTGIAGFAPVPQVRVTNTSGGKLQFNTKYYFKVATVDTCGQGVLSSEEFEIDT